MPSKREVRRRLAALEASPISEDLALRKAFRFLTRGELPDDEATKVAALRAAERVLLAGDELPADPTVATWEDVQKAYARGSSRFYIGEDAPPVPKQWARRALAVDKLLDELRPWPPSGGDLRYL